MSVSIEIEGLAELVKRFGNARFIIEEELEDAVDTIFSRAIAKLSTYPSPPVGSKYVRTYKLRDGWQQTDRRFAVRGGDIRAVLRNPVDYVGLVQGENQAAIHQGRWATTTEVMNDIRPEADQLLQRAGDETLRRIAG
jgi:hypothetical protein